MSEGKVVEQPLPAYQQQPQTTTNPTSTTTTPSTTTTSSSSAPPPTTTTGTTGTTGTTTTTPTAVPVAQPVYVQQPYLTPVTGIRFGDTPVAMECPYCHAQILTAVHYENGLITWIACIALFWLTFCLFFIPFLVNSLKDVVHTCPNCHQYLGKYARM